MIRVHHIGTSTIQGPADDMPAPFDPATHIPPQERAAEAHGAVSAGTGRQDATSPSRACCGEAQAIATWALDQYEDVIRSDYEGTRDFRAMMEEISEKRAELANIASDPVPAARRSPLEHERDAGPVLDPASEVAWLRKIGINSAANLIEALVEECSREFARGYEVGRAVGAVEGPRPMTEGEVDELLGIKRGGKA